MFQKIKLPALLIVTLSFVFTACQKQDAINPAPKTKTNLAAMARTDSKDYKIHGDTAAAWAKRFATLNAMQLGNKMPAVITLPNNGILQLQAEAAAHGVQLSSIAMHLSIKEDGTIGVFYTPVGVDGTEIKNYGGENNYVGPKQLETYDGSGSCGGYGGPCLTAGFNNSK